MVGFQMAVVLTLLGLPLQFSAAVTNQRVYQVNAKAMINGGSYQKGSGPMTVSCQGMI